MPYGLLRHLFSSEYSASSRIAGYCSALVYFVHLSFEVLELRCPSFLPALVTGNAGAQLKVAWATLSDY